jgi:hypothetical protein
MLQQRPGQPSHFRIADRPLSIRRDKHSPIFTISTESDGMWSDRVATPTMVDDPRRFEF